MKKLILMRHAKSAWNTGAPTDHARPLNKRGRKSAPVIAQTLKDLNWSPEWVLSSDSARTMETWQRMDSYFLPKPTVLFLSELYLGSLEDIQNMVLLHVPNEVETLLLLGHNPDWEETLFELSNENLEMTTGNAALLSHQGQTWTDCIHQLKSWTFHQLLRPRELMSSLP